jgi:hypothetical protein
MGERNIAILQTLLLILHINEMGPRHARESATNMRLNIFIKNAGFTYPFRNTSYPRIVRHFG